MPVIPNVLERVLLFTLNRGPAPVLDLFGAMSFEAVTLAVEMGVFDELECGEMTVGELAERVDADEHGLEVLLTYLEAQRYVASSDGRYRNTAMTSKWLTSASDTNMAPWFTFWNDLVFPFLDAHLERAVRDGDPGLTLYDWNDEEPARWDVTQEAFRALATVILDEVTAKVDVPSGATRLLDLGGGHGLFAIELCREHPGLSATVFDNPAALEVAREEIAASDLGDRVDVQGGDYLTDDLGEGFDVVLLFNVIHAHDAETNRVLLGRVADALATGGRVVILDQLEGTGRTPVGRAGIAFSGLTYLAALDAEIHPFEEVSTWLRAEGFTDVTRRGVLRAGPGNSLVQATKA